MAQPLAFHPNPHGVAGCELCAAAGGLLLCSEGPWRVVRVIDAAFPAFYRVVCNDHVAEFSDLSATQRRRCMDLVCAVERVLIEHLRPTKVNLAALGNVVAHLHWHVVARFDWDSHFPQPIWAAAQRAVEPPPADRLRVPLPVLDEAVRAAAEAVSRIPAL
ncbi:MAG TPA: HIT family protein [Albitalea sp.]|nr:HIT family protein [Albitalea sp.]